MSNLNLRICHNAIAMFEANPQALGQQAFGKILLVHGDLDDVVANCVGWVIALKAAGEPERADEITRQLTAALDDCAQTVAALVERQFAGGAS
jgi:hypothetical protein